MSGNKLTALALLSLLGAASAASGQGLGNSPYSRLGLGDFNPNVGGVRQQGMGGVGLAAPNAIQVNELNPALLYYTSRTTYEAAFTGQLKQLRSSTASQRTGSANLSYIALGVPISRRWALAAGLKPLSSVDYETVNIRSVEGNADALVRNELTGSGGLSEVYLGHGVRLAKGLSLGVTTSYIFGTIDRSAYAIVQPPIEQLEPEETLKRVGLVDRTQYTDFGFRTGLHYRRDLSKKIAANVAAVYSFKTNLNGRRTLQQETQDVNGTNLQDPRILQDEVKGEAVLPGSLQLGVSLDNNKNWSLSADVARQQWSKYRDFNGTQQVFNNTWRVGIGGELAPDPSSVTSYFQRVTYRFGLSAAQLPYRPGGQALYDRAVSWGFSFPFPTSSALDATNMNLSFTYGQRGNSDVVTEGTVRQSNIKENYMRVQLGVSLNSRWFLKRRIE
ncbi:outer membrane protein transport protein [Solirubrum puertoriconensis]|uniref:Aromatic hydrocarbon degradation protein n=1 Tax=Solirubrum puertoriconensis TaxID=1751427 RepID=A0A9X0HHH6_SOLP1|nr:outer membrane protein transport protein [Solirubrum puertoriconensis]KUG05988.1 hypothetical protein ASU33_01030 [Solirubrum puertoriconensis]